MHGNHHHHARRLRPGDPDRAARAERELVPRSASAQDCSCARLPEVPAKQARSAPSPVRIPGRRYASACAASRREHAVAPRRCIPHCPKLGFTNPDRRALLQLHGLRRLPHHSGDEDLLRPSGFPGRRVPCAHSIARALAVVSAQGPTAEPRSLVRPVSTRPAIDARVARRRTRRRTRRQRR
jgi:hypothetical protein